MKSHTKQSRRKEVCRLDIYQFFSTTGDKAGKVLAFNPMLFRGPAAGIGRWMAADAGDFSAAFALSYEYLGDFFY